MIHRDIKPANIIIERESGRVVIMDFGIGRRTKPGDTDTGLKPLGTPAYMAPEIATAKAVEREHRHLADLYALGVTAFELLTGKIPFAGEGWIEIFVKHVSHAPLFPRRSVRRSPPSSTG